jgi:hypothetical protein
MPPIARPFPRFISDTAQEGKPYGEWEQRLRDCFAAACEELAAEAGAPLDPETLRFFPDRSWGGRTYLPVVGHASDEAGGLPEYFGHIFYERGSDGEPGPLTADADFTDVTAAENPDWQMDLNDAVIGTWRGDGGRGGDVTLIWGTPMVRGALAATAELDGDVLDQTAVNEGRFSLIAIDAVHGFGDDLYLEVKLWDRRLRQLASESLYETEESEEPEEPEEPAGERSASAS